MRRIVLGISWFFLLALTTKAQNPEVKFIADTLVVQAEGSFEADPDLATLTFDVSSQDKELKAAYDKASQAMQNIVALAEKNGLKKGDISSGALTVTPQLWRRPQETSEVVSRTGAGCVQSARFFKAWRDHGAICDG
jgi:uncharacterized protein YggE